MSHINYRLIEWARANDPTVHRMMAENLPLESIIEALVKDKEQYFKRIIELESIRPRKIETSDGKVLIWQCPPELIP